MSGLDNEKNENAFEVEETLDFNKLKKENYRKYREVYAQFWTIWSTVKYGQIIQLTRMC